MAKEIPDMREASVRDEIVTSELPTSSGSGDQSTIAADVKSELVNDNHSQSGTSSIQDDDCENDDPEANATRLERQLTEIGPAIKVARSKRRGLFGQLALVAEVENPKTYPRRMKWFITFIVALAGATAPMGSSIFFREFAFNPWQADHI